MSYLVGNPEDRISGDAAQYMYRDDTFCYCNSISLEIDRLQIDFADQCCIHIDKDSF